MNKGDCIFIPAFYFYHMQAYNLAKAQHLQFGEQFDQSVPFTDAKPIATVVSFEFQSNSKLLSGFFEAIELKILK